MAAAFRSADARRRFRVLTGGRVGVPPASLSDEELIDAFERGEGNICETLYDRLISVVDGTLCRVLGGRGSDHDDLVQAAFEQIVVTLVRRRFARACSLAAWASSVTANVAFNAIRARTRERRVVERGAPADEAVHARAGTPDVERSVAAREELERIRGHLAAMKPKRATTLFLHDVMGHDLAEIAVLTGVSVAAAQSRLVRGRRDLRQRLAEDGDRPGEP